MTQYFTPKKDEAKASALNCQISRKFSIKLARHIKRKPVNKVLSYLDDVNCIEKTCSINEL
jgi:ribosomal protein L22